MARPKFCRRVSQQPACKIFKPVGVPVYALEEVVLSVDEFEAIRLADLEGLYQEQAAERMNVSRQTFGRIVGTARRKVAKVLSEGFALRIEGGEVEMPQCGFKNENCQTPRRNGTRRHETSSEHESASLKDCGKLRDRQEQNFCIRKPEKQKAYPENDSRSKNNLEGEDSP